MVKVQGCCCCFSLETGVKIIGYLEIIVGVLCLIGGGVGFVGDIIFGAKSIIQGIIGIVVGIFLVLGVKKEKPNFFLPFLVTMTLAIIKYLVEFCLSIYNASKQKNVDAAKLTGEILADVLVVALGIYFLIVVYSLYKSLKAGASNMNNAGMP